MNKTTNSHGWIITFAALAYGAVFSLFPTTTDEFFGMKTLAT